MSDSKKKEDLKQELDAMKKAKEFLQEFINKGENNWTEKDIKDCIAYLDYGKGSREGDNLILKIVKHKNLTSGWLEDFCLSGLHPIEVIKNALKNPNIDSWLLNELYERDKSQNDEKAEWRYIDHKILVHPLCPKDLKDIKCAEINIYFDKLSTYNNMIDQGYNVFINGDEYQGSISIKSFEDLSKLFNVLNETGEGLDIWQVTPHIDAELAEAFGDKISDAWIKDLGFWSED